jgi:soluble lytic murein transglycosylase-like protein
VEPAELLDAQRSLELAAREVARIAARFGARLPVVAAAYNAGDEVVATWLAALGPGADDVLFAAAVPYRETADYVLAVAEGAALFRHLE